MNTAYLLMGGNTGNRMHNLEEAAKLIELSCGNIIKSSDVYETAPWGMEDQPAFYNQAIKIYTLLAPENLIQTLLSVEAKMGRIRNLKNGPRIIDIDILLMDDFVIDTNLLVIPHPRLAERRFALVPLAEIAGNTIHPIEKKTINKLLDECKDVLDVHKISSQDDGIQ